MRLAGWLDEARGALWGGLTGYLVAAMVAATNLDTPITPVASCALIGLGTLVGAGMSRRP